MRTPHRRPVQLLAALTTAAMLTGASAAPAKAPSPTVKARKVAGKQIVVNAKGMTLYRLKPESPTNPLCLGGCLGAWPPLTVKDRNSKVKAGTGVKGKLSIVQRADGAGVQVTLRGYMLYTFTGDSKPGETTGKGLKSFGGTWLTVSAR